MGKYKPNRLGGVKYKLAGMYKPNRLDRLGGSISRIGSGRGGEGFL